LENKKHPPTHEVEFSLGLSFPMKWKEYYFNLLVSLWGWCFRHRLQNFRKVSFSGVFTLLRSVM
jgi:hypothetical protein